VELPRELWRRLEEGDEIGGSDLPKGLDRDAITRIRQAYRERPALPVLETVAGAAGHKLVLLGDPGAGKSTLARYLMLALASISEVGDGSPQAGVRIPASLAGWLPLLVELRVYADARWQDRTFLDLISHLYATEDLGLPATALDAFLRAGGRTVVVFDGLDEVFDPLRREQITRQIEAFAGRYPQVRVIVTSRPVGYQRSVLDAAGFTHYMLQDLDREQIKTFTTAWYHVSWPGNPAEGARLNERLLGAVDSSAAVAELAGNPMLLTILAIIGRRRKLPRDRRNVYEHAVSVLVEQWDATGKHLSDTRADRRMPYMEYQDKLELLHLIARHMQDGPAGLAGNHIAAQDLRSQFDGYLRERFELPPDRSLPAAKTMLEQLRERNFILARFGGGAYGFVHRVFLEYLAADDICQRFSDHKITEDELLDIFRQHWNDPAWQEVLLLITGMIPENFAATVIDWLLE
jgi:predicted NACHT family NTPase